MSQHYWGAKAIMARIGLKDHRRLPHWIQQYSLPAFLRRDPQHPRNIYYTSEPLILLWELAQAKCYREELIRKQDEKVQLDCRPPWERKNLTPREAVPPGA